MKKSTILIFTIAIFVLQGKAQKVTTLNGKAYKTVKIGNQVWMAENLNFSMGRDSRCYENKRAYCNTYGKLYTWQAAKRAANKIAGWHLPSDEEWVQLVNSLDSLAGKKLKSTSRWEHYEGKSGDGNNSSGFSALPGGYRDDGYFDFIHHGAYFWTSTAYNSSEAWLCDLLYSSTEIERYHDPKNHGYSVRLVKD